MDATQTAQGFVSKFARVLWEPSDLIELRALGSGQKRREWFLASELIDCRPGVTAWIEKQVGSTLNVYAGVCPRKSRGGELEHVALARVLCVDWDAEHGGGSWEECEARIRKAGLPAPSLLNNSGHGVHAFYRLKEPILDLGLWTRYQKALIAKLGSDPVIHDPPRIMRLPGTVNFKADPVDCTIIGGNGRAVALESMGLVPVEAGSVYLAPVAAGTGDRSNLGRDTMRFVAFGAPIGNRDNALFSAACEYAGNGLSRAEAEADLVPPARRCGLEDWEIEAKLTSAYSKPRSPSRAPKHDGPLIAPLDGTGAAPAASVDDNPGPGASVAPPASGAIVEPPQARYVISNVVDSFITGEDGERKPVVYYKPISQIGDEIRAATDGWPKIAGGILFVATAFPAGQIPTGKSIRTFMKAPDLFAWLQEKADFRWTEKACITPGERSPRTPATKDEVLSHLRERGTDRFIGVSTLPHSPPMVGVFYLQVVLPKATGAALAELLEMLNPDTEEDRQLMLAALLTPGWGGPPGARPAFIFTSTHGRGVGKTATAEFFAEIWGGKISIGAKEPYDQVVKRLLGDDGLGKRVVLIDNVKGKLGGQEIEALITAKDIDGWRPYYGNYSRPNYMTLYLSANAPQFSQDLSQRAAMIHVGPHKHGESFIARAERFVHEKRSEILADLYAILDGPAVSVVHRANRDRFQAWQDGVLCKIPGADADKLARLIIDRRGGVDADEEDAEDVATAIRKYIRGKQLDPDTDTVSMTREEMREMLIAAKVIEADFSKRGVATWLGSMLGDNGPLARLKNNPGKNDGPRKWVWNYNSDNPNGIGFATDDTQIPI